MNLPTADERKKLIVVASTVLVSVLLIAILVLAAVSPPSPEAVVSELITCILNQNLSKLDTVATGNVLEGLRAASAQENAPGVLHSLWSQGQDLYSEYTVSPAEIDSGSARVVVFYGAGKFQEYEFLLHRDGRRWKVYEIN